MGIANALNLSVLTSLAQPLQSVVDFFSPPASSPAQPKAKADPGTHQSNVIFAGQRFDQKKKACHREAPVGVSVITASLGVRADLGLKIIREIEPGQERSQTGRMVISGRISDVCAELDRMARRERK